MFQPSTAPVCYIAIDCNVKTLPVEKNKLRISCIFLCVKFRKPSWFEDFTHSLELLGKQRINESVEMNEEGYFSLRNMCDRHVCIYSVSCCCKHKDVEMFRQISACLFGGGGG